MPERTNPDVLVGGAGNAIPPLRRPKAARQGGSSSHWPMKKSAEPPAPRPQDPFRAAYQMSTSWATKARATKQEELATTAAPTASARSWMLSRGSARPTQSKSWRPSSMEATLRYLHERLKFNDNPGLRDGRITRARGPEAEVGRAVPCPVLPRRHLHSRSHLSRSAPRSPLRRGREHRRV
jgi:hypothetical protein